MKPALIGLLCVVLLLPLTLVDVPPLLDYPNHLARAVVLAAGAADPILSRMYAAHWSVIPNLATDLLWPPLLQLLPVHLAGRIMIGIAILLPVIGTLAYSRAVFRVTAAWPLASALVAYNAALLLGFLNFVIAIGIALLLAAAWITWRDRYPRRIVALATIGTVVLFFCHLMGLAFFFVLIASHELEQLWLRRADTARVARRCVMAIPVLAAPLCLYLISPLAPVLCQTEFSSVGDKGRQLMLPFANYVLPLDIATAAAVGGFLLVCLATRRCRFTPGSGLALLLTLALFLLSPWSFKETYFLDTRFVIMLGFLLFGGLLPTGLPRWAAVSAITAFTLLFTVRMGVVDYAWQQHRHDLAELRMAMAQIEPGDRVLFAAVSPEAAPGYWQTAPLNRQLSFGIRLDYHMAALLLIERRAYWPFLFDNPSQQPVETLAPYRVLAERANAITSYQALATPGKVELCGFDHLLLLDAGGEPDLAHFAADRMQLAYSSDFAALFRIKQGACVQ